VLLVGICGAVPRKSNRMEIVLGDVVISEVVVELDKGRLYQDGLQPRRDTILDASRGQRMRSVGFCNNSRPR
jgi:nucleoside phosphorylase